jgi:RNA polymerase sigma factor (sigma-70 family)
MSSAQVGAVLRQIRKLATAQNDSDVPDHQLLEQFARHRDEAAFAALLGRHGPMVLGVCQSVLHNLHDAEDAFQAAFLLLAQKAGSIQRREAVSAWLYRVAYHVAVRAGANAARRRVYERKAATMSSATAVLDLSLREVQLVLFEELENLPERYRAPLVLCGLEEKSRAEAARLLGWSPSAVKGKLERGRELLRARLRRRGLELSGALCAAALGIDSASARVSPTLAEATLQAAVRLAAGLGAVAGVTSAEVAALVQAVNRTLSCGRFKLVIALLLAIGTGLTGLGALWHGAQAAGEAGPEPGQHQQQFAAEESPSAAQEAADSVRVRGRVLDPDGKPFAGANLYLGPTKSRDSIPVRATTGADGRFDFTFRKAELDRSQSENPHAFVLAMAPGLGSAFATVKDASGPLTLRLVKDDLPLNGRILDRDGRPIPGVKVTVGWVVAYPGMDLKDVLDDMRKGQLERMNRVMTGWAGPLPGQPRVLKTGDDGRIRLSGFGRDRIVTLHVEGPGIASGWIHALTRPGAPVVVGPSRYYGAAFDHLAEISRPVGGVVRDKATRTPVAGAEVICFGQEQITARTDKDGRYQLIGLPKAERYDLEVRPANGQPYFGGWLDLAGAPGLDLLTADIDLVAGIPLRGRVTDRATGKPVAHAHVDYHALYPNPHILKVTGLPGGYGPHADATTGADGTFILGVLPGPGVLGVTGPKQEVYMPALVTPSDLERRFKNWKVQPGDGTDALSIAAGGNAMSFIVQQNYHALILLDPDEKAKSVTQDVALEPARSRTGSVVGPDGQPLTGVTAHGLTWHGTETLKTSAFTVRGLNPRRPRELLFLHKDKDLGLFLTVRGEEREPLQVKLQPCGAVNGRIVDKDGQPVPGLRVHVQSAGLSGLGQYLEATTGKDGRFRVGGIVAGAKYWLMPQGRARVLADVVVKPGETKDLGNLDGHVGEGP